MKTWTIDDDRPTLGPPTGRVALRRCKITGLTVPYLARRYSIEIPPGYSRSRDQCPICGGVLDVRGCRVQRAKPDASARRRRCAPRRFDVECGGVPTWLSTKLVNYGSPHARMQRHRGARW